MNEVVCCSLINEVVCCSLMNEVVHTSPTIGSNVEEVIWKNIHFLMWDIGGQESLRSAWNTYFTNSEVRLTRGFSELSNNTSYTRSNNKKIQYTSMIQCINTVLVVMLLCVVLHIFYLIINITLYNIKFSVDIKNNEMFPS